MSGSEIAGMTEKTVDINGYAVIPLFHTWQVIEQQTVYSGDRDR
jgi:hypothetical protein